MVFIKKIRIIEVLERGQAGMNPVNEDHTLLKASEEISKIANKFGLFQKVIGEYQDRFEYEITPIFSIDKCDCWATESFDTGYCTSCGRRLPSKEEYLKQVQRQRNKLSREISTLKKATLKN